MNEERHPKADTDPARHSFLTNLTRFAMAAGLVSAYGAFAAIMARFLYPSRPSPRGWMFVSNVAAFEAGASRAFRTPAGETVSITRRGEGRVASDFVALTSVSPTWPPAVSHP